MNTKDVQCCPSSVASEGKNRLKASETNLLLNDGTANGKTSPHYRSGGFTACKAEEQLKVI